MSAPHRRRKNRDLLWMPSAYRMLDRVFIALAYIAAGACIAIAMGGIAQ